MAGFEGFSFSDAVDVAVNYEDALALVPVMDDLKTLDGVERFMNNCMSEKDPEERGEGEFNLMEEMTQDAILNEPEEMNRKLLPVLDAMGQATLALTNIADAGIKFNITQMKPIRKKIETTKRKFNSLEYKMFQEMLVILEAGGLGSMWMQKNMGMDDPGKQESLVELALTMKSLNLQTLKMEEQVNRVEDPNMGTASNNTLLTKALQDRSKIDSFESMYEGLPEFVHAYLEEEEETTPPHQQKQVEASQDALAEVGDTGLDTGE